VFLCDNLISWSLECQHSLSHSNAKVEFIGVSNVVPKSCWLRNLLLELHFPLPQDTLVYCNNVGVIHLSSNLMQHQHTKHIKMDIHFVQEKVARSQS